MSDPINLKQSISDPYAVDIGNKVMQGITVSKTIQLAYFTMNEDAVWAARQHLRKISYPFGQIQLPVNRDMFKLQVGDLFKYTNSKYGISDMVFRLELKEEETLESENITLHATEDFFSVTNAIETYSEPEDYVIQPATYDTDPFTYVKVIEAPYVLTDKIGLIPLAAKENDFDTGFYFYMSIDNGSSYTLVDTSANIQPYGTLNVAYGKTREIDDYNGIVVDFVSGASSVQSITWEETVGGLKNTVLIGEEIMTFMNITPVAGNQYLLENVIRGRFGTVQESHLANAPVWFLNSKTEIFYSSEFTPQAERKFKLVPYNIKKGGTIAAATAISYTIEGEAKKPYEPINFEANGDAFAPTYVSGNDIVLTWTARKRGEGAGVGVPGEVLPETDREGYFEIEVWVGSVLVRTTSAIDALTWTYTNTMNVADNTTPADELTFIITNYIEESGYTYYSDDVEVTCTKE